MAAYFPGDYVVPSNNYARIGDPNDVDIHGRNTTLGRVLSVAYFGDFTYTTWTITGPQTLTVTDTVYSVEVWDVDLGGLTTYLYPERALDPHFTNGTVFAQHYDANSPDIIGLAAVAAIAGV